MKCKIEMKIESLHRITVKRRVL